MNFNITIKKIIRYHFAKISFKLHIQLNLFHTHVCLTNERAQAKLSGVPTRRADAFKMLIFCDIIKTIGLFIPSIGIFEQ